MNDMNHEGHKLEEGEPETENGESNDCGVYNASRCKSQQNFDPKPRKKVTRTRCQVREYFAEKTWTSVETQYQLCFVHFDVLGVTLSEIAGCCTNPPKHDLT